ncbi:MAG: YjbH domain-containing protein [Flavobacteriaceae bacterium]|nr:YjbH domain-containing protein [Flavobacteriaceae bacterium]NVJ72244.1 YjbH domain-containing protein [Flavobacteriaceae bacterium]
MKKSAVLSCLFLLSFAFSFAQDKLSEALHQDGFENIQVKTTSTDYFLAYENNRYRFEADALHKVLKLIVSSSIVQDEIHILIKNRNIPYSAVHTSKTSLEKLFKGDMTYNEWKTSSSFTMSLDELRKEFKGVETINSSFYKVDIPVGIALSYQLGNFDNPIRLKYRLQPELYTTFANGAYFNTLYNIPFLFNDLDNYNTARSYSMHFTKDIRLPYETFLNVNAGYFFYNRYGIWAQAAKFFMEERFRIGIEYRYTQNGLIEPNFKTYNSGDFRSIVLGTFNYRNIKYESDISLKVGKFYRGDFGYNLDFTRQIDEVYISLFLRKSDLGNLVGFRFRTPLGFKKHLSPNRFRVRTREYFKLRYNYNTSTPAALNYDFGEKILSDLSEYYPSTLQYGLEEYFTPQDPTLGDMIRSLF